MAITKLTIYLVVLFIPGIIATIIYQSLENRRKLNNRDYFVFVLLNGFFAYSIIYVLVRSCSFFECIQNSTLKFNFKEIVFASFFAFLLGIIEVIITNYSLIYRIGTYFKITSRSGHDSVCDELFDNCNEGIRQYVYITIFDTNLLYAGIIKNYSMSYSHEKELILSPVKIFDARDRETEILSINKIYLNLSDFKNYIIEIGDDIDENKK